MQAVAKEEREQVELTEDTQEPNGRRREGGREGGRGVPNYHYVIALANGQYDT